MSFLKRFQLSLESLYLPVNNAEYVVAYSGGVDSHVLLYCCAKLNLPVRAVHVHHGLQTIADEWVEHCQNICQQLDIQLDVVYVDANKKDGLSPEEAARNARYDALSLNLKDGDCLITGQHLNDQSETLLLQLLRSANAAGLAAMPEQKQFNQNLHIRPLLSFSRLEIESYARQNSLLWVEDPSNQDVTFDRNFLRKKIMPLLRERWVEADKQLSTVAEMQANNLCVLEDMAKIDLANAVTVSSFESKLCAYEVMSVLSITALKQLSNERLFNLLRFWVVNVIELSPTRKLLQEIESTIINAQQDVKSVIEYCDFECRKFQDDLYLLKKKNDTESGVDLVWDPLKPILLAVSNVQLASATKIGVGLDLALLSKPLNICYRQGGEKFHPEHREHSQSLKKLFQEEGIPPWERASFPLLYSDDELISVVGLWNSKLHCVDDNSDGWVVEVECL